ncbi:Leucine-rich repeat transmembrane neuronal protein 4 [Holothuria leucospilota]|uniref:Leucine-rich repeat transmembrane neuronal protein 4 n=1 Tax=Holothuria leucospilota TaxID=206669 RepID=A0A9Q0YLE5_HOLLE|nr:Leucine-rich repeat transmembrane neuronal protein 4 [Holothuria leucospilota]
MLVASNHEIGQAICDQVCEYNSLSQKADCNRQNLYYVPSSKGCEDSITLSLDFNHIEELSDGSLLGYNHLQNLYISENSLLGIHNGTFNDSRHLQNLVLSVNNISALHSSTFRGAETLLTINLNRNKIQDIDKDAFHSLNQLVALRLSSNKIRSLPPTVFHDLHELQDLALDNNILEAISDQSFKHLPKLRSLSLRRNKLTELPYGLFGRLNSLKEVFLSENNLHNIPPFPVLGINSVDLFYLDHNNLTTSDTITTYLYIARVQLPIGSNPFKCDCSFLNLQMWHLNQKTAPNDFLGGSVMCSREDAQYSLDDVLPFDCKAEYSNPTPYSLTTPRTTSFTSVKSPQTDDNRFLTTQTINDNEGGFKTSVWFIFFVILFFYSVISTTILIKWFLCRENHTI